MSTRNEAIDVLEWYQMGAKGTAAMQLYIIILYSKVAKLPITYPIYHKYRHDSTPACPQSLLRTVFRIKSGQKSFVQLIFCVKLSDQTHVGA
jgi:hypothetical protein